MRGAEFIEGVRDKLGRQADGRVTDKDVAGRLGITVQALNNWRGRRNVSVRQMVSLVFRAETKAIQRSEREAIRPIVEFFEITPVDSRDGGRMEIFGGREDGREEHPYLRGLRDELERHRGIYLLYDSRGRALYVGKARKQTLWQEINVALNRLKSVQQIRRVDHPSRRQPFRTPEEKRRQIRLRTVRLLELAAYLSVYSVGDGLIGELESLLIRSFANDLLNIRMEHLGPKAAAAR